MSDLKPVAPRWAGRVAKWKIARIYEDDAQGMHDKVLINDVAYTLLARCKSMLMVEEARQGRAACPVCEVLVEHNAQKGCVLSCAYCGWTGTWDAYRASMDGLHLIAPGLQPFCREYVKQLPLAETPKEQMYWIDWLIHRCHWEGTALPGQPGATSLIRGRAQDVHAFLDALTAGTHRTTVPGGLGQLWSPEQKEQIQKWRRAAERRRRKRERAQADKRTLDDER
jgi:hypothetical protein